MIESLIRGHYRRNLHAAEIIQLGAAGGLSGAQFWKIVAPDGAFCLRRWPSVHPTPERLRWIHAMLDHVVNCGFSRVPLPCPCANGDTFFSLDKCLWELSPWLPGEAVSREAVTEMHVTAAMEALARFHMAVETFGKSDTGITSGAPAGIRKRRERLRQLRQNLPSIVDMVGRIDQHSALTAFFQSAKEAINRCAPIVEQELNLAPRDATEQVCIRDIWRPHVLFQQTKVTGVVDFGAVDVDSVAADIARLLSSFADDNDSLWNLGLVAYQHVRTISAPQRELIAIYDRSGVLISAMNWIQWLHVERRTIPDQKSGRSRLAELTRRLLRFRPSLAMHPVLIK